MGGSCVDSMGNIVTRGEDLSNRQTIVEDAEINRELFDEVTDSIGINLLGFRESWSQKVVTTCKASFCNSCAPLPHRSYRALSPAGTKCDHGDTSGGTPERLRRLWRRG